MNYKVNFLLADIKNNSKKIRLPTFCRFLDGTKFCEIRLIKFKKINKNF